MEVMCTYTIFHHTIVDLNFLVGNKKKETRLLILLFDVLSDFLNSSH